MDVGDLIMQYLLFTHFASARESTQVPDGKRKRGRPKKAEPFVVIPPGGPDVTQNRGTSAAKGSSESGKKNKIVSPLLLVPFSWIY
jgi:hypothetical protein